MPRFPEWFSASCMVLALLAPCTLSACLDQVAPEHAEAIAALQRTAPEDRPGWIAARPQPVRPALYTALADDYLDRRQYPEAEHVLNQAITGWLTIGHVAGELCARRRLAVSQSRRGAIPDAMATVVLAEARAQETGATDQINLLVYARIRLQLTLNERLEEALLELETHPPDNDLERAIWVATRGSLFNKTGHLHQALADYELAIELAGATRQDVLLAASLSNRDRILSQLAAQRRTDTQAGLPASATRRLIEDPSSLPRSRLLAMLFLAGEQPRPEALDTLAQCHRLALHDGHASLAAACLASRAVLVATDDPAAARHSMDQAVALVDPAAPLQDHQRLVHARIRLDWQLYPPLEAMRRSLEYIATTEALRERQSGGEARARFIAYWSDTNRLLAAQAYDQAHRHPELLPMALAALEQMRARVLLEDRLDVLDPADQAQATAQQIAAVQRALLAAQTDHEVHSGLHEKLRELELQYRQSLLREPERIPPARPPPPLATLQAALRPGEVMLSALTDRGPQATRTSGWLHVITSHDSLLVEIPDAPQLTQWSRTLAGLGDWSAPRARRVLDLIGSALLGSVYDVWTEPPQRLILIPDLGMNNLPIAALTVAGSAPLGTRHELEIVPSAGFWLAQRRSPKAHGSALVLADPELPLDGYRRLSSVFDQRMAPLPGARAEAGQIANRLGTQARLLLGAMASEAALEHHLQNDPALLHFGTHALVHPSRPARSAILLTPGAAHRDGLLQPREIVELDLHGRAVVLAVCAGAAGEWVDGEGLLSLARAFMAAGAPVVLASQWPVDDQHARVYFDRVYRQLGRGQTLAAALRQASRELHAAGYPPEAWAGYLLIGDGAWAPVRATRSRTRTAVLLVAAIVLLLGVMRLRRGRNG